MLPSDMIKTILDNLDLSDCELGSSQADCVKTAVEIAIVEAFDEYEEFTT